MTTAEIIKDKLDAILYGHGLHLDFVEIFHMGLRGLVRNRAGEGKIFYFAADVRTLRKIESAPRGSEKLINNFALNLVSVIEGESPGFAGKGEGQRGGGVNNA